MNTLRNGLAALLALQLLLTAGLFVNANASRSMDTDNPLLAMNNLHLNKVIIGDGENQVTLLKQGTHWQLPDLYGLPVNTNKLTTALDKLSGLKATWPVASSKGSHERFEVGENKYQRRIALYDSDKHLQELLIGNSPGFRKAHVRRADGNEVYALPISTYEFPVKPEDWLDKMLVAAGDIKSIKGPDFELTKTESTWALNSNTSDSAPATINKEKVEQLDRALKSLAVSGVSNHSPDFNVPETITLEVSGDNTRRYQFLAKEDNYYLQASDRAQVFTLNRYDYERIAAIKLADLQIAEPLTADSPLPQAESSDTGTAKLENSAGS